MNQAASEVSTRGRLLAWIGVICWVVVILVKLLSPRATAGTNVFLQIAPSLLGTAGLLFILASCSALVSRLSLVIVTVVVGAVAVVLELLQLIRIQAIWSRLGYSFDYRDILASVVGVLIAYLVVRALLRKAPAAA